jgi:hypothetical protein
MPADSIKDLVAFLLLLARLGDIGSTYLATPTLKLEANPVARRLRWPFAALTLFAALIPYWWLPGGIIMLVGSLLVCSSNFAKLWLMRTMGETEYYEFIVRMSGKAKLIPTLLFTFASSLCIAVIGITLQLFYPDPEKDLGYFFAVGFFGYAFAIALYGPLSFFRYRKASRLANPGSTPDGASRVAKSR